MEDAVCELNNNDRQRQALQAPIKSPVHSELNLVSVDYYFANIAIFGWFIQHPKSNGHTQMQNCLRKKKQKEKKTNMANGKYHTGRHVTEIRVNMSRVLRHKKMAMHVGQFLSAASLIHKASIWAIKNIIKFYVFLFIILLKDQIAIENVLIKWSHDKMYNFAAKK